MLQWGDTCSKGTRTISTDVNGSCSGINSIDFEQIFSSWDWNIISDSIPINSLSVAWSTLCGTEQ